ncbi:MAG: class I SAM-dependent methyltransferase [Anaerolineales bacterium]|nr:class I SAM-dependent methyltransferase [Anaerolineales bacterium]MCB9127411.1 class I SAM-dependent methyltransferase [Ardenticatenales bacterium]
MVQCVGCGHYYQNPRPTREKIGRYYPESYMPFELAIEDEPHWWRRFSRGYGRDRRCAAVHEAAGGRAGRVLDIGSATGIFLDGMRRLGWDTVGVEPSQFAADYARSRFGLDIYDCVFEAVQLPPNSFDLITLWDVLEHLHDPLEALAKVAFLLRADGLLVINIPNPNSVEAKCFKRYWLGWDLPRHLNLWTPESLRHTATQSGFTPLKIESFTSGYTVLLMCMEAWLNARGANGRRFRQVASLWPFRLVAKLYYHGPAKWFNLSSIMTLYARRQRNI